MRNNEHTPSIERDLRRQAPQASSAKIGAVGAACAILDFLAESDRPVGVQKVSEILGLTKSRASRHLSNLEELGLVSRETAGRGYQLGWRVMRWGSIASERIDLKKILAEPLKDLNHTTGKTVLLSASAHGEAIVTHCLPSLGDIRIEVKTGLVLSLPHSPTARVCFAFQPRERRQRLLGEIKKRESGFRVENETEFNAQITAIQSRFYCWDKNKYNFGYGALAAPIFNEAEALAGAVSVIMPSDELDGAPSKELIAQLLRCGETCSRLLRSKMQFPHKGKQADKKKGSSRRA